MSANCEGGDALIFDSDILIWHCRNNPKATELIEASVPFSISAVSYMELMQGVRDKNEWRKIKKILKELDVAILPITEAITYRAMRLVDDYALSDSMELGDALIAATCIEGEETLCTANEKHYKCVPGLSLSVFRP